MKALIAGLAAALAATAAFAAPSWKDYPGIENTSFVEANGDRAIQLSVVVKATPQQVWDAFTTEAGWKSWASPTAYIDLRLGGTIETSYSPNVPKGQAGNIVNRIEAYVPGRMLAIRNIQTPPGFPSAEEFGKTATIIELIPAGEGATKVVLTNIGYGQGPGFDTAYRHFEWGDAYTLDGLRKRFERGPVDWSKPQGGD